MLLRVAILLADSPSIYYTQKMNYIDFILSLSDMRKTLSLMLSTLLLISLISSGASYAQIKSAASEMDCPECLQHEQMVSQNSCDEKNCSETDCSSFFSPFNLLLPTPTTQFQPIVKKTIIQLNHSSFHSQTPPLLQRPPKS